MSRGAALSFGRQKRLLLGWLALLAPIPLPFNAILSWPVTGLYLLAMVFFLRRAARDPDRWLPVWSMNVLAVLYLPLLFVDMTMLSGDRLRSVTHLLLFTVLVKLYGMVRERDKWQAVIAIFFLFLASMATSVHPSIVLYMLAFVVSSLLLFARFAQLHLAGGFRPDERSATTEGVPLGRFLTVSTLAVLLFAVPIFASLPRVRAPFIVGGGGVIGGGTQVTGFSDQVTLDSIGQIRQSREVAMRVTYDPGPVPELRFKGGAFDIYRGGTWEPTPGRHARRPDIDGVFVFDDQVSERRAEIFLRPMGSRSLMLPMGTTDLEVREGLLFTNHAGVVMTGRPSTSPVEYTAHWSEAVHSFAEPAYLSTEEMDEIDQLPENRRQLYQNLLDRMAESAERALSLDGVTPRIADLAATVAGDGPMAEQAQRIETHLSGQYTYSTTYLGRPGADPLEEFLFERRTGHCEYFASSMVLMLRSRGIPARLVTGFLGGDYNPLEGYFLVRQSNAHAWVEAFLPERGWTVFDPTPPAGRPETDPSGWRTLLAQGWDTVVYRWDRYVLTFGFADQVSILGGLSDLWNGLWSRLRSADEEPESETMDLEPAGAAEPGEVREEAPDRPWVWPAVATLFILLVGFGIWQTVRSWRPLTGADAYRLLKRRAARVGIDPDDAEPPLAFLERLSHEVPAGAEAAQTVIGLYVEESFAGAPLDDERSQRLSDALGTVLSEIAERVSQLKECSRRRVRVQPDLP